MIYADFDGAIKEQKKHRLGETERRCPVTDNIKTDTTLNVSIGEQTDFHKIKDVTRYDQWAIELPTRVMASCYPALIKDY